MLNYIEYLNLPTKVAVCLVGFYLLLNVIGEILEFKGKVVPEFVKIRKYFDRKKKERENNIKVAKLLDEINNHYSADNIAKRDKWMEWVNGRADVYDDSISEINKSISDVVQALKDITKITEEIFVQSSRDRIIDFATKSGSEDSMVSREEFNRIFKVYTKYEKFLEERGLTNGEVDIAYRIIKESYEKHMKNRSFIEDVRGYNLERINVFENPM